MNTRNDHESALNCVVYLSGEFILIENLNELKFNLIKSPSKVKPALNHFIKN